MQVTLIYLCRRRKKKRKNLPLFSNTIFRNLQHSQQKSFKENYCLEISGVIILIVVSTAIKVQFYL